MSTVFLRAEIVPNRAWSYENNSKVLHNVLSRDFEHIIMLNIRLDRTGLLDDLLLMFCAKS